MSKHDWSIEIEANDPQKREVMINGVLYKVSDDTACLSHALLLIVDELERIGTK